MIHSGLFISPYLWDPFMSLTLNALLKKLFQSSPEIQYPFLTGINDHLLDIVRQLHGQSN